MDLSIEAGVQVQVIETIYDAYPEAIEDNRISSNIDHWRQQVQSFISSQLAYSRQAKDIHLMTTPDDNGQLPLHTALQNDVRLGSIKLLVRGNPSATSQYNFNFYFSSGIVNDLFDFYFPFIIGLNNGVNQ